ncbi:hypothetical protein ONS95_007282 [Cadophora gregata]|uniref:uncharacterized protein n=1 Tax=Cadophora gregata TaxID=51156 RepID=UPI0026DC9B50|nr:uncharacterized protein ONS95_007282 [Cadophora gregata]KAK0100835.1 hypothetical protein ONS95_007282 [Cadophora gregata]KAK0117172.1 hypothetical protein ONS96_013005 [Cadophora gregata f. sp. sojae]
MVIAWWYRQVNEYATRELTHFTDRFPALSGLAKEYSDRTGYHYTAGIWLEDFRRGLLWKSIGGRTDARYSPSWSWATAIDVPACSRHDLYVFGPSPWSHIASNEVQLVHKSVKNVGGNPFGQVILPAKLSLRGICRQMKDLLSTYGFWFRAGMYVRRPVPKIKPENFEKPGPDAIVLWMDSEEFEHRIFCLEEEIFVLQVARFKIQRDLIGIPHWHPRKSSYSGDVSFGLVLEPTLNERTTYRRIGIVEMPIDGSEELGWEMKTVTIV